MHRLYFLLFFAVSNTVLPGVSLTAQVPSGTPARSMPSAKPVVKILAVPQEPSEEQHQLLRSAEALHRQLRPTLSEGDDYVEYMQVMLKEGAQMVMLMDETTGDDDGKGAAAGRRCTTGPQSLAVYRVLTTTSHGRKLYVEDLVTNQDSRSRGYGGQVLDYLKQQAQYQNCDVLALDSGVQRADAHRFYFRHGLVVKAFAFLTGLR